MILFNYFFLIEKGYCVQNYVVFSITLGFPLDLLLVINESLKSLLNYHLVNKPRLQVQSIFSSAQNL